VRRDELLVVQATGPRGARERRQRTRPHPVAVKIGPYLVRGLLHALPTADPFVALRRRPPMVPLTDGSISYTVAGSTVVRRADTIIVNRAVIDWVTPGTDDDVAGPELPALPAAKGILLKDFTGEIHPMPHDDVVATPIAVAADVEAVPSTEADADPTLDGEPVAAPAMDAEPAKTRPVRRSRRALRRAG
jgi:hypothetical protein